MHFSAGRAYLVVLSDSPCCQIADVIDELDSHAAGRGDDDRLIPCGGHFYGMTHNPALENSSSVLKQQGNWRRNQLAETGSAANRRKLQFIEILLDI